MAACAAPAIPGDSLGDEDPNSADSNVTGSKAPKKTTTPKKDTTDTAPPEADTTPAPAPTPTTNACAGQQGDACFDCCDQASGGTLAPADEAFGQCACGGGACSSAACKAGQQCMQQCQ